MRPHRKLNLNWHDSAARRAYKRADMRKRRLLARGQMAWNAAALFEAAMDQARRTQVALPRDPVLDHWRVQQVVRVAFDSRFGPYRPARPDPVAGGRSRVPSSEGEGKERAVPATPAVGVAGTTCRIPRR